MPSYNLEPVSFKAPTDAAPFLTASFRLPSTDNGTTAPRSSIHPATGLQLSFVNNDHEVFLERLTARDVETTTSTSSGTSSGGGGGGGPAAGARLCSLRVPAREIPRLRFRAPAAETDVRLHAWKGEKWLGSWSVGTLTGLEDSPTAQY